MKGTLFLSSYLVREELPEIPPSWDWGKGVDKWGLYRNDEIGDCAIVGPANLIHLHHDNAGRPWTPPEAEVIQAYSEVSGYDPQTGANDRGCVMLSVMNYWRKKGICRNIARAYVGVNTQNIRKVKTRSPRPVRWPGPGRGSEKGAGVGDQAIWIPSVATPCFVKGNGWVQLSLDAAPPKGSWSLYPTRGAVTF